MKYLISINSFKITCSEIELPGSKAYLLKNLNAIPGSAIPTGTHTSGRGGGRVVDGKGWKGISRFSHHCKTTFFENFGQSRVRGRGWVVVVCGVESGRGEGGIWIGGAWGPCNTQQNFMQKLSSHPKFLISIENLRPNFQGLLKTDIRNINLFLDFWANPNNVENAFQKSSFYSFKRYFCRKTMILFLQKMQSKGW